MATGGPSDITVKDMINIVNNDPGYKVLTTDEYDRLMHISTSTPSGKLPRGRGHVMLSQEFRP